jgi:ATP-dependent Clp protease ATP-binding subunit ClpA
MSALTGDVAAASQESLERLARPVLRVLEEARELARLAGRPVVEAGHLVLALLGRPESALDALLQRRFDGLRAATLADSLRDILMLAVEGQGMPAGTLATDGPPRPAELAAEARAGLARAAAAAGVDGFAAVTVLGLTRTLLERPPPEVVEAFQDAGVGAAEIESLARQIAAAGASAARPPSLFQEGGGLDLSRLGPAVRKAVACLACRAALDGDLQATDSDLLACLLAGEDSRLAEALLVMGISPAAIRRDLERGRSAGTDAPAGAAVAPSESQLSRLLRRLFEDAAVLAAAENRPLVSESHLLRVHLDRVGGGTGNLYQRLGIDVPRLRALLQRYAEDREPAGGGAPVSAEAVDDLAGALRSTVINQEEAIERVLPAVKRLRAGLAEPGRPLGVFLFLGPTGVGKTELARGIATLAFGAHPAAKDAHLIRLDCGNFKERRDLVQLVGASQGLVGYKEGQLTNGLRDKPRSVLLFDEAEKAHPEVWQSLLPLFDEGLVREADGTEYDATGCILVATSNLGYQEAIQELHLWQQDLGAQGTLPQEVRDLVWRRVEEYFSPEFRARFGRENVIFFRHFDRASYRAIVRLQAARLIAEMAGRGLSVEVPDPVVDLLAELAWQDRPDGARPVRRLVTRHLRDPIVEAVLADRQRTDFFFVALEGRGEVRLLDELDEPGERGPRPGSAR